MKAAEFAQAWYEQTLRDYIRGYCDEIRVEQARKSLIDARNNKPISKEQLKCSH